MEDVLDIYLAFWCIRNCIWKVWHDGVV